MELRSFSHFHFIHVTKGGSTTKSLNVTRGKPVLRFKKIEEIYEAEDAENVNAVHIRELKDGSLFDKVKLESQSPPLADRRTSESVSANSSCSTSDGESCDLDDINFCNITLKQILESCKTRKRKFSKRVDSSPEFFENHTSLKQYQIKSELLEDEDDLGQTLRTWKLKLSKNKKHKKKCKRNDMATPSQIVLAMVKSEPFLEDQNVFQPFGVSPTDDEVNELNPQVITQDAADSSIGIDEPVDSCGVSSAEVIVTASEGHMETAVSFSSTEEQCCVVNEACHECTNYAALEHLTNEEVSGWEIVNVECPEIISYHPSDCPATEFVNQRYFFNSNYDIIRPQPLSVVKDFNSYMHDIACSDPQVQGLMTDFDSTLQCTEIIDVDGPYLLEDGTNTEDLPSYPEACNVSRASNSQSENRLQSMEIIDVNGEVRLQQNTADHFTSYQEATNGSPMSDCDLLTSPDKPSVFADEDKHILLSTQANAVTEYSIPSNCLDVTGKSIAPGYEDQNSELVSHPERLFSTRKVISPTSQERLQKAMQANESELCGEENSDCRGKLMFRKQSHNAVGKAEGCYKIRRAEGNNMRQTPFRSRNDKKGYPSRGIMKVNHSSPVSSLSTRCTSSGNLSESAIAFSQRQMQDIESLATKLTGELTSMVDVVNELLHSQVFPAMPSKPNMDKVTMAIKNATKAEETAKKWLSIMARDCNRFCKIMNLTEKRSISPDNVLQKDKKKITFADEAGGKLCHVKFFTDDVMHSEQEEPSHI